MENNEMNLETTPEIQEASVAEQIPAPPQAYENPVVAEPQPLYTPTQSPVRDEAYVPAVHAISPINPAVETKKSGKGLTVFILLIVFVLVLTIGTGAGYIVGKEYDRIFGGNQQKVPAVELIEKPDGEGYTVETVYNMVNPSVVRITVYSSASSKYSYASGVIYSEDGYIVTNDHIYAELPNPKFFIQTYDGKIYEGSFVAGDTRSDLAVLKISAEGLTPAVFGDSDQMQVGEVVVAVGNPDGAAKAVATSGIVSAVDIWASGQTNYSTRLLQTDAALNPGSSGGALANSFGQVVGITSSKIIASDTDLVNYAIPTSVMKRVVESLIKNGYVTGRSRLGISYTEIGALEANIYNCPCGVVINSIDEDSNLYGKGLQQGDIITHMNDVEITTASVMLSALESTPAGTKVSLRIYTKNGEIKTIEIKLQEYVGSSSYVKSETNGNNSFDFPMGE